MKLFQAVGAQHENRRAAHIMIMVCGRFTVMDVTLQDVSHNRGWLASIRCLLSMRVRIVQGRVKCQKERNLQLRYNNKTLTKRIHISQCCNASKLTKSQVRKSSIERFHNPHGRQFERAADSYAASSLKSSLTTAVEK